MHLAIHEVEVVKVVVYLFIIGYLSEVIVRCIWFTKTFLPLVMHILTEILLDDACLNLFKQTVFLRQEVLIVVN